MRQANIVPKERKITMMIIEMRQTERNENLVRAAMKVAAKEEAMVDVLYDSKGWKLSDEDLADAIDKAFQYMEDWNKLLDDRYAQMCLVKTHDKTYYAFDTGIDGGNLAVLLGLMEENGKLARLDGGAFIHFEKDNVVFVRA
jgi:hypothetical protein